jgi:membrane protein required for beta-lactamase induction
MILITLVLALLAERFLGQYQYLRHYEWFNRYVITVRARLGSAAVWDGPVGVIATLALPLLAVGLLQALLHGALLSLLGLVFGVAILLFTLGPRDLDADAEAYCAGVEADDAERAQHSAGDLLGYDAPPDAWTRSRAVTDAVLAQCNTRLFGVLFWYALLGPLGAVLFRLAVLLPDSLRPADAEGAGYIAAARRLHEILAWLPARLVALSYALSGSFEDAMHGWNDYQQEHTGLSADANSAVLMRTGAGALRLDAEGPAPDEQSPDAHVAMVKSALGLMWRTLIIWLGVLLLLSLAGLTR